MGPRHFFFFFSGFNFRLKPGKQVDYETGNRNYDCTFVINDGIHDSDTYQYSLTITEVNEPPKFSTSMYYVTINEGPVSILTIYGANNKDAVQTAPFFICVCMNRFLPDQITDTLHILAVVMSGWLVILPRQQITKTLIRLRRCTG